MAVGSAFDAYAKAYLHDRIYGKNHKESAKYDLKSIFEAQVESQHRDAMFPIGAYIFKCYKDSGALADLMLELQTCVDEPRFEFEVRGTVDGVREGASAKRLGIPLLGKPDLKFINAQGASVVYDWKCNGYYSKASPLKGYIQCRDQSGPHWERKGAHKDAHLILQKGIWLNAACYLEECSSDWATQIAMYGWLLGDAVGVENIVGVDQLVFNSEKMQGEFPHMRVASHRSRVSSEFQYGIITRLTRLWNIITDKPFWFFRDLSPEDSAKKCALLDGRASLYADPNLSEAEAWAISVGRQQRNY